MKHTQKNFKASSWNGRQIGIKIDDDFISFTFPSEGNREYYWLGTDEWKRDVTERLDRGDNWHIHMRHKTWFSDEMYQYINQCLNITAPNIPNWKELF